MIQMRKILKTVKLPLLFLSIPFILTGCDIYHADIPEYTSESERDQSFEAKTFQAIHEETEDPVKQELDEMFDEKFPEALENGEKYRNEVEDFQDEVVDSLEQMEKEDPAGKIKEKMQEEGPKLETEKPYTLSNKPDLN